MSVRELVHESAFAGLRGAGAGDGVIAVERLGLAIATVIQRRGQSRELSAAVAANFALDLPVGAEWTANNGVAWLGTGPEKWLAISESGDRQFVAKLETKFCDLASVIEQSDALGVLRLTGPALFKALQKGVQIDLAPDAFPTGTVAVTSIAHIGVILWKVDDQPTVDIAVARSLCNSFLHWLEASAALYGLTVLRGVS